MTSLSDALAINPDSPEELRAVELATNDFHLLRELIGIRKQNGLTQGEIADLLGISQPAVAKFERMDADPKLSTIRRYANAVGAVVCHAVVPDDGSVTLGAGWRIEIMTLPTLERPESSRPNTYVAAGPKQTLYAVAA